MYYFCGKTVKYIERNLEECLSEENIITQCAYLPFHLTAPISRQEKVKKWLSAVLLLGREVSLYLRSCLIVDFSV